MATIPVCGLPLDAMYLCELQTHALENFVWVCATNQVGTEDVDGQQTMFYGKSCIIHLTGEIKVLASETKPEFISHDLDLEDVVMGRSRYLPFFRAHLPRLYTKVTDEY
jgi:predicted amidohydrolase